MALKVAMNVNQAAVGCEGHHWLEKVREGHLRRQTFEINFDKEFVLT